MTALHIPELSLVVLVGASGSGKSTFARAHFAPTETISSDYCRGLVADDENDQSATKDAFEVLHFIAGKRLAAGRLTVVDATNVQHQARRALVELARAHDVLPVAIVLDVPESVSLARNAQRPDRDFGAHVVKRQREQLRRSLRGLTKEGFRAVHVLSSVEDVEGASVVRDKLLNDHRDQHGPVRRHRRRPRLPRRAGDPARPRSATRSSATTGAGRSTPATPRVGARSSSATSSTAGPTAPGCCGW